VTLAGSGIRKLMLKTAAVVLVPAVAAAAALVPMLMPAVRAIAPLKFQTLLAAEQAPRIRVAALGDSHAAMGFRPSAPGVFSLAYPGENIYEAALKLDLILDSMPQLRAVAIQAQPHMFFPHRQYGPRAEYLALKALLEKPLVALLRDPCCRGALPGMALRAAIGLPLAQPVPLIEPSGYSVYPSHVPLDRAAEARHEISSYMTLEPVPALRREFTNLVARLRQRRVDVVLTRFPLSQAYLSTMPPQAFTEADEFFGRLAGELQLKTCGRWNAVADESWFYNADHLTPEGATMYWQILEPCFAEYLDEHRKDGSS
jgi:hypothetical protein